MGAPSMRPVAAAFVAISVAVTAVCSYLAFLPQREGTLAFWLLAGAPTVVLAAAACVWARREDLLREWLTPRWGDFSRGVVAAVLLFGVAWAFAHYVAAVGSPREVWLATLYAQLGDPRLLQKQAPLVGAGIFVVAAAEEIVWRGAVTQLLAERVGSRTAWVWSAVLYALAFVPTAWALRAGAGPLDPVLPIAALGAGLLWGAMAHTFGRLGPGILAHAMFDYAVVMMFPLWGLPR